VDTASGLSWVPRPRRSLEPGAGYRTAPTPAKEIGPLPEAKRPAFAGGADEKAGVFPSDRFAIQ